MKLTYSKVGDYMLPNLEAPAPPRIGKYGMLRQSFLREERKGIYTGLFLAGNLNQHLEQVDTQANEMLDTLIRQMKASQGITEKLKAQDQIEWLRRMNSVINTAEEIVLREIVYI